MEWLKRVWAWFTMVGWAVARDGRTECPMEDFPCRSGGQCISLDLFCDGVRQCTDGSDEPAGCTPCNRTYYGKVGGTYKIQVARPSNEALPHFCQLTFIASGGTYGDLVHLTIDKFNLGRFMSHTVKGCPDGHMQIEELSRPLNAGYWCGTAWGTNVYFSETSAVTVMLRVFNNTLSGVIKETSGVPAQEAVLLRLTYRFLIHEKALLRYGPQYNPSFRGEVIPETYCDKFFENCDRKNCKIQSPNFPGMYPRNLTCFFHVKQTLVPEGKVALVTVYQKNPYLIYVKEKNAPHISKEKYLQTGDSCNVLQDYLTIYDGNTTKAPVLIKACKGGTLTHIVASGAEMLIMLHASPFDFPFQDSPRRRIFGFQLNVDVKFVDRTSTAYVQHNVSFTSLLNPVLVHTYTCQWTMSSHDRRSGYIQAPIHSVLANTNCMWRLVASKNEIVWLYFLNYRYVEHEEIAPPLHCPTTLAIYDGSPNYNNNTRLVSVCKPDQHLKVCSGIHTSKKGKALVSCPPSESYVSTSSLMTVTLTYPIGTVPSHVEFLARYEFVNTRQWGEKVSEETLCDRIFTPFSERKFASPHDVFMFGRGGAKKLRCTYTFDMDAHQRIIIKILHAHMGSCVTGFVQSSRHYECLNCTASMPSLWLVEHPWEEITFPRACLCNVSSSRPVHIMTYTGKAQLIFNIPYMSPSEDFRDYFFEGEFELISAPRSNLKGHCDFLERKHSYPFGNFTIGVGGLSESCDFLPRIVEARDGSFLFLRVKGFQANETNCGVGSRVNIFAVGSMTPVASLCPEPTEEFTNVFSRGWTKKHWKESTWKKQNESSEETPGSFLGKHYLSSRNLIIEYLGNYSGRASVTWMSIWRPLRHTTLPAVQGQICPHQCPDIKACLLPELWCDGNLHCPSGADEGPEACGLLFTLPWVSLVTAGALAISLVILIFAVMIHTCRTSYRKSKIRSQQRREERRRQQLALRKLPSKLKGPAVPTDLLLMPQDGRSTTNS